jgi:probable HAF family extracellular repeat protein
MYRIKSIGNLGGCTSYPPTITALNGADQLAGSACNAHGYDHAFLWKNDGKPMVDLGPAEVGSTSRANALSPSGIVAGSATDSTGSFAFISAGNGTPMTRIYNSLGGTDIDANDVNDLGQLTGWASVPSTYGATHAFVWKNDGSPMHDIGIDAFDFSAGNSINASGQVAATAGASTERFAHFLAVRRYGRFHQ